MTFIVRPNHFLASFALPFKSAQRNKSQPVCATALAHDYLSPSTLAPVTEVMVVDDIMLVVSPLQLDVGRIYEPRGPHVGYVPVTCSRNCPMSDELLLLRETFPHLRTPIDAALR